MPKTLVGIMTQLLKHLFRAEDQAHSTHIVAHNLCTATVSENQCSLTASVGNRVISEREGLQGLAHSCTQAQY